MSFYHSNTPFKKPAAKIVNAHRLDFDRYSQFPPANLNSTEMVKNESQEENENGTTTPETISVNLRLRPSDCTENCYRIEENVIIVKGSNVVNLNNPNKDISEKHYTFNQIMNDTVDQREVYENTICPSINDIFTDPGATFLTYGTSSSGKTYTMLGDKNPGIVLRAITHIFTSFQNQISENPLVKIDNDNICVLSDGDVEDEVAVIKRIQKENRSKKIKLKNVDFQTIQEEHGFEAKVEEEEIDQNVFIWISFIEIYNEKIVDLLDLDGGTLRPLKIMSNDGNSYVKGMTSVYVRTMEEANEVLHFGLKRVKYSATGINENSSRSHSIFFMTVVSTFDFMEFRWSTYKFCDLAGAERLKKTGNVGDRLKETGVINSSLLVLGRCLEIVHQNQKNKKHQELVPVRDSKLTFLLQSSLQGKEKFVMIVNLFPSLEFFEENLNVLNFAAIAKQIVVQKMPKIRNYISKFSRYSLFKKAADSPRKTGNSSFYPSVSQNECSDDSSLDDGSDIEFMTEFDLRAELRRKAKEVELYRDEVRRLYELNTEKEKKIKDQMFKQSLETRQRDKEFHEQELALKIQYYEKKLDHLKTSSERRIKHLEEDREELEEELSKAEDIIEKMQQKIDAFEKKRARRGSI